jgi:hypothetical protein
MAEALRQMAAAAARRQLTAARQSREGQQRVEDDRKERAEREFQQVNELVKQRLKEDVNSPEYRALRRQKVRLKRNGAEMEWYKAQVMVNQLRWELETSPGSFKSYVAMLKGTVPGGRGKFSAKERRLLKQSGILGDDGRLTEWAAKVLEASLVEKTGGDGITLADPVAYTKEFVEKWGPVLEHWEERREEDDRLMKSAREAADKMDPSRRIEAAMKALKSLGLRLPGDGPGRG